MDSSHSLIFGSITISQRRDRDRPGRALGRDRLGHRVINPGVDRLRHHDGHDLRLVEVVLRPDLGQLQHEELLLGGSLLVDLEGLVALLGVVPGGSLGEVWGRFRQFGVFSGKFRGNSR